MMKGMWWRLHYLVCCYHRVIFGGGDYITCYDVTIELYCCYHRVMFDRSSVSGSRLRTPPVSTKLYVVGSQGRLC